MTDAELITYLRFQGLDKDIAAASRIEQLKEKLDKAVNIATLALNALDEIQTYKSPLDPWEEDALAMRELDAFDFHVEFARADIAKLERQHD